ncbi:parallel beta-helix repeat protein [Chitinophaga polysaccharea]|uniref:Parallel beta-helix repeat protein n=1 Tax=Chitinophaga polysaccharea TaxID=1293035 RepID=A0A561Q1U2_9BACT|nr:right-handed parallel beta-helix repeat-containing protein [Chitinophaga polysaccharea]TWF44331.1 parallel beta-helix repeat protein [Chitinophaga polysaccharea]
MLLRFFLLAFFSCTSPANNAADKLSDDKAPVNENMVSSPSLISSEKNRKEKVIKQATDAVNITQFGAVGDGVRDNRAAVQKCLDYCKTNGKSCYIPTGNFLITGDLWLMDNSKLIGGGNKSKLIFNQGMLRSEKGGSRNFRYTNNYNNEVLTDNAFTTTTAIGKPGALSLTVDNAGQFKPGQLIYLFNNKVDSWTILEDQGQTNRWNDAEAFARSEIFTVKSVSGSNIKLDRPLKFTYNKGAKVSHQIGAVNIEIGNISIENQLLTQNETQYAILLEQPNQANIHDLTIQSSCGGINLTGHPYKCIIKDCNINTTKEGRGILVENFGSQNSIIHNNLNYNTGGDAALIVLMGSGENKIVNNTVTGHGQAQKNECGIAVHAQCYNNQVYGNTVNGTAEGLGAYYGAFSNDIHDNTANNVSTGFISFYARNNQVTNNVFNIVSNRKGNKVGILLFGTNGTTVKGNNVTGDLLYGVQIQGGKGITMVQNQIKNNSAQAYAFGIKVINVGNDVNISSNTISSCKTGIDAETPQGAAAQQSDIPSMLIQTNSISTSETGIRLQNYANVVLKDNDLNQFSNGITLSNSPYNVITNNKMNTGKAAGINLVGETSSFSYIENNVISNAAQKVAGWKSPDGNKTLAQPKNGFMLKDPNTGAMFKFNAQQKSFQRQ